MSSLPQNSTGSENNPIVTGVCDILNWIQTSGPQSIPGGEETYFRCPKCRQSKYVYEEFRAFLNFPVCIDCALKSLQGNS